MVIAHAKVARVLCRVARVSMQELCSFYILGGKYWWNLLVEMLLGCCGWLAGHCYVIARWLLHFLKNIQVVLANPKS